ncbi:MAG: acyl-CoA thioesterase [Alphaproteobacteria bacterium]|nr:MAG: acyl-CoA thioesterase [Alphaproteobacteria bacterium]
MNLWLRLIYFLFAVRFRKPIRALTPCTTPFRCWPADLDTLLHMNNSRYLAIMDIARIDLITRCGLWKKLRSRGHYPIVEAQTIRYRKSIKLFQRFTIVTHIQGWDEKSFYLTQTFMRGNEIVAEAMLKGRFLKSTRGTVPPADIMEMAGYPRLSPPIPKLIAAWAKTLVLKA